LAYVLVDDAALAEELVQEAFVGLYLSWHKLRSASSARSYVRASVLNSARSELRSRQRRRRRPSRPECSQVPSAEDEAVARLVDDGVLVAIRRLPPRQREVVLLRYWLELSVSDTAAALRISEGSVKSAASRGLHAVRERLGGGENG
jgi:RNA polymerase sigma factor (sigma-70 family)